MAISGSLWSPVAKGGDCGRPAPVSSPHRRATGHERYYGLSRPACRARPMARPRDRVGRGRRGRSQRHPAQARGLLLRLPAALGRGDSPGTRLPDDRRAGLDDQPLGACRRTGHRASPPFAPGLRERNGTRQRLQLPQPFSRGFNAASEWEAFEPLYPGDKLHLTTKLVKVEPKQTRLGNGAFITTETRMSKQRTGELVLVSRGTGSRYDPTPDSVESARASRAEEPPATEPPAESSPVVGLVPPDPLRRGAGG